MDELNVLVGGRTGDGIPAAGLILGKLFRKLGYYVYMNMDYPSIIVGGHQYVDIRATKQKRGAHVRRIDILVAFNQDALDRHRDRWYEKTIIIYNEDRDTVDTNGNTVIGVPVTTLANQGQPAVEVEQLYLIGAAVRALGLDLELAFAAWKDHWKEEAESKKANIKKGYDSSQSVMKLDPGPMKALPILTGTDAISQGLLQAGLDAYVAYPMTPTSPILEFMAKVEPDLGVVVSLPESEIAVMIMALGYAYMGLRTAIGTSGGGFSLMVEGLSLAGQAELPVVIILGQRAGPGTGMPTYTSQSELSFVLSAGHGEFPRLVVAPGDAEEAFYWSAQAVNLAWKYQVPAIVLVDKTLCLNSASFEMERVSPVSAERPVLWDGEGTYLRYQRTEDGISPMAVPPLPGEAVKSNSYVHDEYGLTSENPLVAQQVVQKRFMKRERMAAEMDHYETVQVTGSGETVLVAWGSNKGVCTEIASRLGLRLVQVIVMAPFPREALHNALAGAQTIICVELNYLGQLADLLEQHGIRVHHRIGKYDGRPYAVEELENDIKKVIE